MGKVKLTRKELYDLIWGGPMSILIKKYNTSYGKVRKICIDLNIPIPENGYWSKIQFGKEVLIEKLPLSYTGNDEIYFSVRDINTETSVFIQKSIKNSEEVTEESKSIFRVSERLVNPDIFITNTRDYFEAVKKHDWRTNKPYPTRKDVLSIDVSYDKLPRALRIMDAIIKLLRSRNYDVRFKNGTTCAFVEGEDIEIRLKEKNKVSDVKTQYGSRKLESTGKFVFIIGDYHKKEVGDGIDLLETKLSTILAKLEAEGNREKEERIAREIRWKEREEKERIEKEIRERKEKESRAFKDFFVQATRLHQANILREYIQSVESNAIKSGNNSDELNNWILWAKQKVEWYDPLINKEDSLLNDNYKTNHFKDFLKEWQ